MKNEKQLNSKESGVPMGAYGVYDDNDLDSIQNEIKSLNDELASGEVNEQLITKVNQYNSKALILRALSIWLLTVVVISFFGFKILPDQVTQWFSEYKQYVSQDVFYYVLIGAFAQLIDGALGMGYGVICNSFLMLIGISPIASSAGIHSAEIFTTGASGLSHLKFKNVNIKLFKNLLLPGVIGALLGAYLLTQWNNVFVIKPLVSIYIYTLGYSIVRKALRKNKVEKTKVNVRFWAVIGGTLDAIGGGGWGPIVTSKLISVGRTVNYTIGSVNLAEFFVALAGSSVFFFLLDINIWSILIGLVIGGLIAAPFAAYAIRFVNKKALVIFVGVLVMIVSLLNLYNTNWVEITGILKSLL